MSKKILRIRLTREEKLEIMTEYMDTTGQTIKTNTTYKGYNIGRWQANFRAAYYSGKLDMEPKLLGKFIGKGIIRKEKERIQASQQEKYEFLMGLVGKSEEEQKQSKMKTGLSFLEVKHSLQIEYNRGQLKLSLEQIDELMENGFLNYSREVQKRITEEIGLPRKYAQDIVKKYGSYQEFLRQYKSESIDYEFGDDIFCGYRGITISEQEMTVEQKLGYANLVKDLFGVLDFNFEDGDYIDIDSLNKCIEALSDTQITCIRGHYGLDGDRYTYQEMGEKLGIKRSAVGASINRGINDIRIFQIRKNNPKGNVKRKLQQCQRGKEVQEIAKADLEKIRDYIRDENGNLKEIIDDISLEELGIRRL